ncbi:hypothetical protein PoB_000952000 [Plakobranchus ocellatus]|uniref:Uncharacterized protein n=1 Tax=Plakobranchus ocellatus TaxID=259542 RepID=A0AAV3YIV2_9GAST|nr:hypothetical protein PoB_000952000 [Plakobranchus ocellatus]
MLKRTLWWKNIIHKGLAFAFLARPQHGDIRLLHPPSGQHAGAGARTRNRRVPADLRADSLATVLPTPRKQRSR